MESVLRLKLFGSPEVWLDEEPLTGFITTKSRALLFFLVMKPGVHGRHTLAALLWPETTEPKALKNLRDVLSNLRKLAGAHLDITRQTAAFRRDSAYVLDVEEFSALLEQYKRGAGEIGDLETAVSLYKGDFLDGFHLAKTERYEAWLTSEREQLWQAQKTALNTLAARYAAQADYSRSLEYVSRLLRLDPYCEQGQRLKIALLARLEQRNDALAQYAAYRHLLNEELGVAPAAETTALYEQIKAGGIGDWRLAIGDEEIANRQSFDKLRTSPPIATQIDWGDIPGEAAFYGRREQLKQLLQWLNDGQHSFIAITGMGGVGKTALAARLVRRLAQPPHACEFILWRSLINVPPLTAVLQNWLETLSGQQLAELPESIDEQLSLLLTRLREHRCLLVLDNFESVMASGVNAGRYRAEYEAYGQLIQRIGGGRQGQSCLLITSRELPGKLARLTGDAAPSAVINLSGLPEKPGVAMLRAQGLTGTAKKLSALVQRYSGNPLALKLAADTARTLFAGDTGMLLADTAVYGDIRDVLDEQFHRLTPLEEEIITWLAVEREPVSAQIIWDDLARPPHKRQFLEALRSLYFRSLLESIPESDPADTGGAPRYTLQNVIMEYAAGRFIEAVCREIEAGELNLLQRIALLKARAKEYVQQGQRRLLLEPVVQWLVRRLGLAGAVNKLRFLLKTAQMQPALSPGYAAANILHLLVALDAELDGWDFSHLPIRQADLRHVVLRGVSFRGSDLSSAVFRDTFGIVPAVAFSPDGQFLAAVASEGSITLWRLREYQPWRVMKRLAGYDISIAFSPDGQVLAGGGSDNVIRLWDVASGQQIRQLTAHTGQITAVLFHPDGQTLISSSEDQTIGLWDAAGGQLLQQIPTPGNLILALAASPDGQIVAGGGYDGMVYLWRSDSGAFIRRLGDAPAEKIHAVAFSPDGALLAAAGEDHEIQLWDVRTGEKHRSLTGHANFVLSAAFHPDGRILASSSADKTIRLWDWRRGRTVRVIHGSANWITSVAFSPDGEILASGSYDRQIRLWQSRSGHLLHTLQGSLKMVNLMAFSTDGRLLGSASYDRPVLLWDAHDGALLRTLQGHSSTVRQLAFSPDGRTLAISGDENKVRLWDTQTGQLSQTLTVNSNFVRTLAFSPDGRFLAAGDGTGYGAVVIWEAAAGQPHFTVPEARTGLESHICFSPDGRYLAYSSRDFALNLLDVYQGAVCCSLTGHQSPIEGIRFSPDGSLLASLDRDGTLYVWRAAADGSFRLQAQFPGSSANVDVWNLAFSPDGRAIACQLDGGRIGIFDGDGGRLLCSIQETLYGEGCMVFSGDGSFLLTGSGDGRVRMWDAANGERCQTLAGHEGIVRTVAADGVNGRIASSGDDGTIRLWHIPAGECALALTPPGPYEGLDITGAAGLSPAQVETLKALGAVTQ